MNTCKRFDIDLSLDSGTYITQIDSSDGVRSILSFMDADRNVLFSTVFPFGETINYQLIAPEGVTITHGEFVVQ